MKKQCKCYFDKRDKDIKSIVSDSDSLMQILFYLQFYIQSSGVCSILSQSALLIQGLYSKKTIWRMD